MNEKPTTVIDTCEDSVIHKDKVQQASARKLDESTFDALAETFKILSNQTRLKLIQALSHDELCVCDLAAILDMTDSAVSHQLRILRNLRLVKYRREGKMAYYSLDDQHVRQLFEAALEHQQE
jgi:ArsR family transcriptional regulator